MDIKSRASGSMTVIAQAGEDDIETIVDYMWNTMACARTTQSEPFTEFTIIITNRKGHLKGSDHKTAGIPEILTSIDAAFDIT